jgi:hypothetical protein
MSQDYRYSGGDALVSPSARLGSFRLSDFEDPNFDAKQYVDFTSRSVCSVRLIVELGIIVHSNREIGRLHGISTEQLGQQSTHFHTTLLARKLLRR